MTDPARDTDALATPLAWAEADGRIRACNPAFASWLGVSARRLQGLALTELDAEDGRLAALLPRHADSGEATRMRRAQPRPELPGECAAARVPVGVDEAMVCDALRGEFRMHRAEAARMQAQLAGWRPDRLLTRALLVDEPLQAMAMARVLSPSCTDEASALASEGRAPEAVEARLTGIECWSAYISCMLADIAMPAYARYGERALDHAAVLRLLLAAQRVADGDASPARAAVEAGVAGQPVEFDAARQRASVVLHLTHEGGAATFTIDLGGLAPAAAWRPSDAVAFAAGQHGGRR